MALKLKTALVDHGIRQGELAKAVGISRSTLNGLINHDQIPRRIDREKVERSIAKYMHQRGCSVRGLFKKEEPLRANATAPVSPRNHHDLNEDDIMLLPKQSITMQARQHFGLHRDPFADPASSEDVFFGRDIRYVREAMYQISRHGGLLAVTGESGAGKSTLREEMIDRLQREERPVVIIEPYVLSMEPNDTKGKTLKSQHIAEAILATIAPTATVRSCPQARFRQLHAALRDSARAGHAHVLIIEEAHSLPTPTINHLKRFYELKDGLKRLLSVILLGHPELLAKLNPQNPAVREVAQRFEIIRMQPLDIELELYLEHRFKRIQIPLEKVIDAAGLQALREKLTPTRGQGSLLYPLAIHNALAMAINRAADLGVPMVTADVIKGV